MKYETFDVRKIASLFKSHTDYLYCESFQIKQKVYHLYYE